jgi:hypothetical protein
MNEYILIFRHEDGLKIASQEQIEIWMNQTRTWMSEIADKGGLLGGNGLVFEESRVVHPQNKVTNGPFGKIKETVGGYIIVKANTLDDAVQFAKGCPVLQGVGNTVEVRKIAKNDGIH